MAQNGSKTIAQNRKAFFDYTLIERIEAGIVLTGTEIKSVRSSRVNIQNAFARPDKGELWLHQMHIAPWPGAGPWAHEPMRSRKLLLTRKEITHLIRSVSSQRLTLVPLRIYIRKHNAKVELALARGRRKYDKRQAIKQRESDRDIERGLRTRE